MGIISTVLVFWSLSGFILKLVQMRKKTYLNGTNIFVLRQINNKINTTVISMSVICLMLFVTITILSTALSLRNSMETALQEMTSADINLYKTANLPESIIRYGKEVVYSEEARADSKRSVGESMIEAGFDMNKFKDKVEISIYAINEVNIASSLGEEVLAEAKSKYPMMLYDTAEPLIKVSEYNKVAKLYGIEEYSLSENEYIMLCDFGQVEELRNKALALGVKVNINGKEYEPKYRDCKAGFVQMNVSQVNTGIILVPDSCDLKDEQREQWLLVANYNAKTEEEIEEIEQNFTSASDSELFKTFKERHILIDGMTKISLIESSLGLTTIILFIGIYLGIIFLIASSAILALKQLTESSDNRQRYVILRKIGCDEKMINNALFKQIGIFFMMPLLLAIIHSIFGIQFGVGVMEALATKDELIPSAIVTVILIGIVYGMYFLATYYGSKNIIKED